jgi:hypothetical protein
MAIITPVGNSEFDWSPKGKVLTKTASTGTQQDITDKDALFAAAKSYLSNKKAQIDATIEEGDATEICAPCQEPMAQVGEISKEVGTDAQKAVADLVDKAKKAEELAGKIGEAVEKVEQAVQEVKEVVGGDEVVPEEVEIEIEDDAEPVDADTEVIVEDENKDNGEEIEVEITDTDEDKGDEEAIELEVTDEEEGDDEDNEDEGEGKKEDEIIQESCKASKKVEMKSASTDSDGMVRVAKLSPSVKKKIYEYWKNDLGYIPDFCKLLVTDYEK